MCPGVLAYGLSLQRSERNITKNSLPISEGHLQRANAMALAADRVRGRYRTAHLFMNLEVTDLGNHRANEGRPDVNRERQLGTVPSGFIRSGLETLLQVSSWPVRAR